MSFNAEADAQALHKAIDGAGTDEKAVLAVLTKRTKEQIGKIRLAYEAAFKSDLHNDVCKETAGKARLLWSGLVQSPGEFRANLVQGAVDGLGTSERVLIDCLVMAPSPAVLDEVREVYSTKFQQSLIEKVEEDTSGNFRKLLMAVCQTKRATGVKQSAVEEDADALYKAGKGLGTDDDTFIKVLTRNSHAHNAAVAAAFQNKHNQSLVDFIKSETSGWYEEALCASTMSLPQFVATSVHKSVKGLGTDDGRLIRVCCLFERPALHEAKAAYAKLFPIPDDKDPKAPGKPGNMLADVKDDTSMLYERTLTSLLE